MRKINKLTEIKKMKKESANAGFGMCLSDHYMGYQHHLLYAFPIPSPQTLSNY